MDINSINKLKKFLFFLILMMIFNCYCQKKENEKKVKVNFSHRENIYIQAGYNGQPLKVAVSAMISPEENFFYYNKIFDYISRKTGRKIIFKQRKSYQEINELLRLKELDFAFICSGAYINAKKDFNAEILAIPQIKGEAHYHAYIIVRSDSNISSFEDLKGCSFAFTDPMSNTGYLYPRYLVSKISETRNDFFKRIIYTYAHDYSIQAVATGLADAASVDSIIFNYIRNNNSQKVSKLKILKKSQAFGMPPVVVNPEISPRVKEELQTILFSMSADPEGKKILSNLEIDKFVSARDRDYDSIRKMKAFIRE